MNEQTDQQLLRDYAERQSEGAFAELVRRHVDLVHSAAIRMVGDPHLAKDVTQAVFVALAQNAQQLTGHPVVSGWLHRAAQNTASKIVRTDVRRRAREQEAAVMTKLLSAESEAEWEKIAPHLDAALGDLSEPDRDAVLLRYFERKSAHEIAQVFGISDEAAQKRLSRAVERMREFFSKRGVTIGAGGLVVVISANAVQAAPVALAAMISTGALLTEGVFSSTAITATKAIAMTTLQKTLISTVAILAGAGIHEARQALQLRERNKTLQQQQAPLIGQIEQLTNAQNALSDSLAALRDDNERLKSNTAELLRLREEVTGLRRRTNELTDAGSTRQQEKPGAQPFVPVEEFANAGLASPEATAKTLAWATRNKNQEMLAKILDAGQMQEMLHQMMRKAYPNSPDSAFTDETNSIHLTPNNEKADLQGYQILSQQFESTNRASLEIVDRLADGSSETSSLKLRLVDGEWKMDIVALAPDTLPITTSMTQPDGSVSNTIINFHKQQEQTFVPAQENSTNP